jgi:O-succinylbenzoic acid--CoA ligase
MARRADFGAHRQPLALWTMEPLAHLRRAMAGALAGGQPWLGPDWPGGQAVPPGAAVMVPSSGSTGSPKWVALAAGAIKASAAASAQRLGGVGGWLLALPTTHMAGLNVLARAVLADGPLAAAEPSLEPGQLAQATARLGNGPKFASLVPTQLHRALADGAVTATLARFDAILVGGAGLPPNLRAAAAQAGLNVVETYGMAETAGGCVYDGAPLDGVTVSLEPGGRIDLAGPTLALGYTDLTATAQAFSGHGLNRVFRSRDLGRLGPDGRLKVIGRWDNVIVTGGIKVSPEPVEALLATLPGVQGAAVVGLPSQEWGQAVVALVAGAHPPTLDQVRSRVKGHLTSAHAPQAVGAVPSLPQLAPGKLDRAAAARLAAQLDDAGRLAWVG